MTNTVPLAEAAAVTTLMRPGWAPGAVRPPLSLQTSPGAFLRRLRLRLGLTTREVAGHSREIASERGSPEFAMSHARLLQIETGRSSPGLQKLFSLSLIYGAPVSELLDLYLNPESAVRVHAAPGMRDTRLVPVSGESPLPDHVRAADRRYALIGLEDRTMDPLIRPGALVQIDESEKLSGTPAWRNEFERPVYFLETRAGYICSWCDLASGHLISIPHSLSPCHARAFAWPREVEVVGRVTAVAGRIA